MGDYRRLHAQAMLRNDRQDAARLDLLPENPDPVTVIKPTGGA
jgi:hypothetical protein